MKKSNFRKDSAWRKRFEAEINSTPTEVFTRVCQIVFTPKYYIKYPILIGTIISIIFGIIRLLKRFSLLS